MGRPSTFRQKTADEICRLLAEGSSLRKICSMEGMPGMSTVCRWLISNDDFREQYARAREIQAEILFDEVVDIADEADSSAMRGIEHARLRIDARKWAAGKMAPKKYSEKLVQEISGPDGGPVEVKSSTADALRNLTDEQLAQLEALATAASGLGGNPSGEGAA